MESWPLKYEFRWYFSSIDIPDSVMSLNPCRSSCSWVILAESKNRYHTCQGEPNESRGCFITLRALLTRVFVASVMWSRHQIFNRNWITDTPLSFSHCCGHLLKTMNFSVWNKSDSVHVASLYEDDSDTMCKKISPCCWMHYGLVF